MTSSSGLNSPQSPHSYQIYNIVLTSRIIPFKIFVLLRIGKFTVFFSHLPICHKNKLILPLILNRTVLTTDSGSVYWQMEMRWFVLTLLMALLYRSTRAARRSARASCTKRCTWDQNTSYLCYINPLDNRHMLETNMHKGEKKVKNNWAFLFVL